MNPAPWAEGEKIPWDDPQFSARMLKEHLSQANDAASRRAEIIDRHARWIHEVVLHSQPGNILDLGCGPGFYMQRFAQWGHRCTGIDFSPASITYARQQAIPGCTCVQGDIRHAEYGTGYDLVMFIYGEFNVFKPDDARLILRKAWEALRPGGSLLLEPHTYDRVRELGEVPATWYSAPADLFADQPHLALHEAFWNAEQHVATNRWYIVDARTAQVTRYADSMQAYTDDEYRQLLADCGFAEIEFYPSLSGEADIQPGLMAVAARKSGK